MRALHLATIALLLHSAMSCAAQLIPRMDGDQLGVQIEADWPATLRKDLTSGLTNRILIRLTLARGTEIVSRRAVEIAVRYDLWDERFLMNVTTDGAAPDARTIESLEQMQATLGKLSLPHLFATTEAPPGQQHTITAEILLNPVDRERMELIRKWVAENSIAPADIGGRNTGGVAVAIFNRIFEQYAKGAEIAAIWRETLSSRPFRPEELPDEGQ